MERARARSYLRRTTVEREPAALREIFLRLGHIYRERVPDARRAIAAYERVRGIEPDNREALQALSELYVAEGDHEAGVAGDGAAGRDRTGREEAHRLPRPAGRAPDARRRSAPRGHRAAPGRRRRSAQRRGRDRAGAAAGAVARRRRPARVARPRGGPAAPRRRARRAGHRDAAGAGRAAVAARAAARGGGGRRPGRRC